jgi:putative membrane protein
MDLVVIIFYVFLGILIGTITGLTPGLHPNILATLFIGFTFADPILMSVIIISAAVTHSFLDFIPSIFLGAPEADTAMGVLPGHKMLLQGRGYEAIRLTVIGGLGALFIIILILPIAAVTIPNLYNFLRPNIHFLLIGVVLYMFWRDKSIWSVVVFGLSGLLGYFILTQHFLESRFALFPLLSGLFGLSTLIYSLKRNLDIPAQDQSIDFIDKKEVLSGSLTGSFAGILVGLLPGIGAAEATFLAQEVLGEKTERKFMIAIGGINTADVIFSLLALWLIGNPRSGAAVAVEELMSSLKFSDVLLFISVIILVSGIAGVLTLVLSKNMLRMFRKINYRKLSIAVILLLLILSILFSGLKGLSITILSTLIGLTCVLSESRRSYLMGCLIVPTILFFL